MEQHPSNIPELTGRFVQLRPNLPGRTQQFVSFCNLLAGVLQIEDNGSRRRALEQAREEIEAFGGVAPIRADVALKFACSVIVDVVAQGWQVSVANGTIELRSPASEAVAPQEAKRRIREGHLLERDAQLREPVVRIHSHDGATAARACRLGVHLLVDAGWSRIG